MRASAGHSLNQSMVQQLTRLGNLRRRALHTQKHKRLISMHKGHSKLGPQSFANRTTKGVISMSES